MTEIAELAGVRRPSVSTWRRRHADFPKPVRDDGQQPLFDAEEVAEWLDGRPIPGVGAHAELRTYGDRLRDGLRLRTLAAFRGLLPGDQLLRAGLALAALRHIDGRPLDNLPLAQRRAQEVEEVHPELAGMLVPDIEPLPYDAALLVTAIGEMCEAAGSAATADRLIAEADRLGAGLRSFMTPPSVSELIAELAGDVTGRTVYDPAAGSGSLLLRIVRDGTPRRVVAADRSRAAVRMLRQRLICQDSSAEVIEQDSLRSKQWFGADLMVLDPPFTSSDHEKHAVMRLVSWVRYAVGQLVPGGRAIVLVPAWMLTRVGEGDPVARARDDLVRQGTVSSVIQLAPRLHSYRTGTELVVLVLERPAGRPRRDVLLCNADRPEGLADIVGWVRARLPGGEDSAPSGAEAVPIVDLGWHRSLLPAQALTPMGSPSSYAARVDATKRRIAELPVLERLVIPPFSVSSTQSGHTSVGELVERGQLRVLAGVRLSLEDIGDVGRRVLGAPELSGEVPVGQRRVRDGVLRRPTGTKLTESGDVVVLPAAPLCALIDLYGDAVVQSPAKIIRIAREARRGETPVWMTPRVLAALMTAPRNAGRASGSLVRRIRLTALELPNLAPDEVERLDAVLRDLERHRTQAAERLAALDELTEVLVAGVADDVLTVQGDTSIPGSTHGADGLDHGDGEMTARGTT